MASNGLALFNKTFIGLNDVVVESRGKVLIYPSIASNYSEAIRVDVDRIFIVCEKDIAQHKMKPILKNLTFEKYTLIIHF